MACAACAIKFTIFKRKKQCMDCLRYFCTECVIRRFDRILSCDNCSMLSRRPIIRSQVLQMRSKYLRQYLLAKKVSIRGCIEKEDLVNLLITFANGDEARNEILENRSENQAGENQAESNDMEVNHEEPLIHEESSEVNHDEPSELNHQEPFIHEQSPARRSRSPQINERSSSDVSTPEEVERRSENIDTNHIEIEEVSESEDNVNGGPEPVITEHEEVLETSHVEKNEMVSEIPMWTGTVNLSDIKELFEFEFLSVKQLKDLLRANRVDYKGCVERSELLDRACRLWTEYQKSRKVIENADEDALCKICLDAPIECVILECGHMACCINCGKQMSECPICRQYVVRVVRFFKA